MKLYDCENGWFKTNEGPICYIKPDDNEGVMYHAILICSTRNDEEFIVEEYRVSKDSIPEEEWNQSVLETTEGYEYLADKFAIQDAINAGHGHLISQHEISANDIPELTNLLKHHGINDVIEI